MSGSQKFLRIVSLVEIIVSVVSFAIRCVILYAVIITWDQMPDITEQTNTPLSTVIVDLLVDAISVAAELYLGFSGFRTAKRTENIGKLFIASLVFLLFLCVNNTISTIQDGPQAANFFHMVMAALILFGANRVRKELDEELI